MEEADELRCLARSKLYPISASICKIILIFHFNNPLSNGWTDGRMDGRTDGRTDRRTDGWTDGRMDDGWMTDGWMRSLDGRKVSPEIVAQSSAPYFRFQVADAHLIYQERGSLCAGKNN